MHLAVAQSGIELKQLYLSSFSVISYLIRIWFLRS